MTEEENMEEFYSYYGKFCVRFEYVMANVRGNIEEMFRHIGVSDYRYVLALLNKDTANQLSDKLKLVAKLYYHWPVSYSEDSNRNQIETPKSQKSIDIITKLSNYINDLSEYRNLIVHGTWTPDLQTSNSRDLIIGNYHRPKVGEGTVIRTHAIELSVLKSICDDLVKINTLQEKISELIAQKSELDLIEIDVDFMSIAEMKKKLKIKDIL